MASLQEHVRTEDIRWALSRAPASSSRPFATAAADDVSSHSSQDTLDGGESIFSSGSNGSRRSSVSSVAAAAPPQQQQWWQPPSPPPRPSGPLDYEGNPVVTYASLDDAVAASLRRVAAANGGQLPQYVARPGRLYDVTEPEDEIIEPHAAAAAGAGK
ncbi:hypothetical protein GGR56DRAFT_660154 [Xylariaceae sp. FL0804]|nr:hypothetical protein GGR56DRAFT_660154 [Xylariaceae sp. FL0804]